MDIGVIYMDVDEKSVTGETIIIDRIEVARPEITYEKTGGTDNFKTILNNVKKRAGKQDPSEKQKEIL